MTSPPKGVTVHIGKTAAQNFANCISGNTPGNSKQALATTPPRVRTDVWRRLVVDRQPVALSIDEWAQIGVHYPFAADALGYRAELFEG